MTGPNLNTCEFSSGDLIKMFMTGVYPSIPELYLGTVDVRDVA